MSKKIRLICLDFIRRLCYNSLRSTISAAFIYPGVAQIGSALEWGSRGRRFNSCHSDQKETTIFDRKLSFLFVLFTLHFFRSSLLSEIVASIEKIKEKK